MVPFNTPFPGGSVTCGCKADPEQARPRQLGPGQKPPESNRRGNKKPHPLTTVWPFYARVDFKEGFPAFLAFCGLIDIMQS